MPSAVYTLFIQPSSPVSNQPADDKSSRQSRLTAGNEWLLAQWAPPPQCIFLISKSGTPLSQLCTVPGVHFLSQRTQFSSVCIDRYWQPPPPLSIQQMLPDVAADWHRLPTLGLSVPLMCTWNVSARKHGSRVADKEHAWWVRQPSIACLLRQKYSRRCYFIR